MPTEFEIATTVHHRGAGCYDAAIADGWDIGGNANGGYLIALAARAMADAVGRPPLSVTAHFVSPGLVGACTIDVEVVRAGRRMATCTSSLRTPDGEVIRVLGTFGDQDTAGPRATDGGPPVLPSHAECPPALPPDETGGAFRDRLDVRVRPGDEGFRRGRPTGRPEIAGWFAFADHQPVDAFGLLLASDAFAPVVFNLPDVPVAWAPTLELTVHVRGVPAAGPLRCRFRSRYVQGGMFEEDGEVWDADDRLVAQSRQLALIPRPR